MLKSLELSTLKELSNSERLESKTACTEKNEYYVNQWKTEQHKIFMEGFYEQHISTKGWDAFAFDLNEDQQGARVRSIPYSNCGSLLETFKTEFGGWKMNPHVITVQVLVTGVSDLDPVGGSFQAKGEIVFRWHEPKFENRMMYEPGSEVPLSDMPSARAIFEKLSCPNATEFEKTPREIVFAQQFEHWPIGCAKFTVYFTGTFMENFELNQFPFDVQDLKIFFELDMTPGNYRYGSIWIPDWQYSKKVNNRALHVWRFGLIDIAFSEWQVYEPHVLFGNGSFDKSTNEPMSCLFCMKLKLRRKFDGWLKNVFSLLWLISSFSFSAFSIDPEEGLGDRISIVLTLLLTATAFKFVIADSLPKVTYMTVLDKYVAVCNAGFTLFVAMFSILPLLDVSDVHTLELTYFLPTISGIWLVFNIVFLYRVWRVDNLHKATLGRKMREIKIIKNQGYRVL